jgi:tetratricopeptide (TPR) repeat protein
MKKLFCFCILVALFCCFSCKSRKYDNLPATLAELCRQIDNNPKNSDLYQQRAEYYYENRQINEALVDILHAIKLNDNISKYYVTLADIYLAKNETDLVEEMLNKAISIDNSNDAYLKLAELFLYQYMYKECDETLEKAIRLKNYNPKAFLTKAILLKETGDTIGWLRMMQLVIDQDPREVLAYTDLACFFQDKLDPIAINYYKNALEITPNDKILNYNLGKLYQDLGKMAWEIDNLDEANYYLNLAKEQYQNLITLDPNSYPAFNNLGYIALNFEDNYYEAVRLFSKAIEIDSLYDHAWCNRGITYEYLEEWSLARADFLQCKKINPNNEKAIIELNRLDNKKK